MIPLVVVFSIVMAVLFLRSRLSDDGFVSLDESFPLWKVENDCILAKNGDITVCFRLTLPEIFSLSGAEYAALHGHWVKAIGILPAGTTLHKQDWFQEAGYKADFEQDGIAGNDGDDFISGCRERFFHERPYLQHESLLFITWTAGGSRPGNSAASNLLKKSIVPKGALDNKRMQELLETVGKFQKLLSDSGLIQIKRVFSPEITGGPDKPGLLERYLFLLKENDRPVLKDILLKPDWKIGAAFPELFTLADVEQLPAGCGPVMDYTKYATDKTRFSVGFAAPVGLLLPVNHVYNQYIRILDTSTTLKRLEGKRKRLQSLSAYSRENSIAKDATADYLNEAIGDNRLPVKAHFNLLAWTENRDGLKPLRGNVAAAISHLGAVPYQESAGAPQIWWAGLPGNEGAMPENECFDTFVEQASCFLNMETAYRSSDSPFGIRLGDRLSGLPVHVDISDEPMKKGMITNRNKIVVGGSGSGKSMFMNHLLRSYVSQGAHCIVVDVGHSYEGLCELLDGYYFTYTDEEPISFNPFYIPEGALLDTEKKESIKTLLVALWKQGDETFRRSEYVAISNALSGYYTFLKSTGTVFPCFDSFYEYLQTAFVRELQNDGVKDRDFDIDNFLYVLRPYYKGGEFDYLLNARENLDVMSQPFIVFELDNVKDHPILFPVITLIIMEMFISKMRKLKGVRKVIVIEEAWKAIARSGMAEFMKYLYKTVRKYYGEAVTVTQEIDDIISSPIIKEAIINNADCKILLDMKKFQNKFEAIQEVLGMSNKGRDLVLSINRANDPDRRYREVYIELGNQLMKVYRYEPSPEEFYAYSTEETDKLKVKRYTEKFGGDIKKGLAALVADMKSEGTA
ncbi:Bacteroides conjugation system ATPase, TraG family [Arachidicoccus rhizosphaerae]|uniref:Bacteroides conjugation system ATPase, TraG family n=1 Tax=Arachidicoccus rhizosphaerae TaxID=551991 RepID=A0A1H3YU88_9BACT|nr:TraG family conjugative transposon ATPase [Arachidicoccus rhizosphaerae]SEA14970.1 Bacteroides conjugation system ATPase, TraG family [Arachidicoccus rhizosphaerae]